MRDEKNPSSGPEQRASSSRPVAVLNYIAPQLDVKKKSRVPYVAQVAAGFFTPVAVIGLLRARWTYLDDNPNGPWIFLGVVVAAIGALMLLDLRYGWRGVTLGVLLFFGSTITIAYIWFAVSNF